MIIFDVETGPLPIEQLRERVPPFVPSAPPGAFDPWAVKTGAMKDPLKIQAKVEAARVAHEEATQAYEQKIIADEAAYWESVVSKAALSAVTGRVLAIGVLKRDGPAIAEGDDTFESQALQWFWELVQESPTDDFVGFNIFGFDLPFMIRRSWALGIDVPPSIIQHNRNWCPLFVDLMQVWSCGNYREYIKLDDLAAHLGVERKSGDGANFYKLWESDRSAAIEYLTQDLRVTMQVAQKMGVC